MIWRDAETHGFPPGRTRITSPYDADARHSAKRGTRWTGFKVHVSQTCDNIPDADGNSDPAMPPNPITNVVTTRAAVADQAMATPMPGMLADRDLLPAEHLMDAGYPSTASLLACRNDQVRLACPAPARLLPPHPYRQPVRPRQVHHRLRPATGHLS